MQNRPLPERGPAGPDTPSGWAPTRASYRPLGAPAGVVKVLLAVYLLVTLAALASDWLQLNLPLVSQSLGLVLGLLCFELVRQATRRQQARAVRLAVAPSPPANHSQPG